MGIPRFPGLIYATDGSQEKGNMGASTDTKAKQEASAKWVETKRAHAAACIALEDAIAYAGSKSPLILLTDSECLLMAIQKWIGEGIDPTIKEYQVCSIEEEKT